MPEKPRKGQRMRLVAAAAVGLVLLRLAAGDTALYGDHVVGSTLRFATFAAVLVTVVYYPARWLSLSWERLMWRVRRRLAITYILVGLTPLLLMASHSLLSWLGLSAEAMARVVTVQVASSAEQMEAIARTLAADLDRQPQGVPEDRQRAFIAEREDLLRAALPGARATLVPQAALPRWLDGQASWSGLTREPPPPAAGGAAPPVPAPAQAAVLRAVARSGRPDGRYALLIETPLGADFVRHLSDLTGIRIRAMGPGAGPAVPMPIPAALAPVPAPSAPPAGPPTTAADRPLAEPRIAERLPAAGRLPGEGRLSEGSPAAHRPVTGFLYAAFMPSTDWATGKKAGQVTLAFDWSWAEAGRQILGSSQAGRYWRLGLIVLGFIFLTCELLALGAAAWMVRAVTGTVDRLYRATTYIARGDFSHRIQVRSQDQLGELARHFNEMSAHIESLLRERVERERLEREIEIAATVQSQLFPRSIPLLATARIAGECRAARGVAGDYYDYLEVAPGRVALALGDVAGKGLSASLLMSNLQACLRAQTAIEAERADVRAADAARELAAGGTAVGGAAVGGAALPGNGRAVARIASMVNRQLCRSADSNRFATLFLALYDDDTRLLRYTNAGHNAPILVNGDGTVERLVSSGTVVGAFDDARYDESHALLGEDALLVIFSDGISEARSPSDEEYGEDRLVRFAVANRALQAGALCSALFAEVDSWSGPQERGDDQTLVIVKGHKAVVRTAAVRSDLSH